MKNYFMYHCHTMLSNPTTTIDSTTHYKQYIEKAKESGMKAMSFSEHGNIFNWVSKKLETEKAGLKYVHSVESYVTKSLDEKVRDNYHVILIALNLQGVYELNRLISNANNREDGHFYYNPRITYDELKNTSDNIVIITACLGGILNSKDRELKLDFIEFMVKNKHRCFLEIQHHKVIDQINYNKLLYEIHKNTKLRLIAGTDTHNLDENYARGRIALQRAKNIHFASEEGWDLNFKTYDELVVAYENQNSLPKEIYLQAIENTNLLANMVEEFELDRSHKYPRLYENSEKEFLKRIKKGVIEKGINKKSNKKAYQSRIEEEFEVYKKLGAIDYVLFQDDMLEYARQNDIAYGYGRGSVNGSLIAYILGITHMDSIKHDLNFFRFMNPHRVSLCDIDIDYEPSRRQEVIDWIFKHPKVHAYGIVTFNTVATLGSIDELGRAFKIPLDEVKSIKESLNTSSEAEYRNKYPQVFELMPYIEGTVISVGYHASGYLATPFEIQEMVGTFTSGDYTVSQCNMIELDFMNWVKLDILGLSNIEIINKACKLANIPFITPDNVNDEDDLVWDNLTKSGIGIFQFEKDSSHAYLAKLLSKEIFDKIQKEIPTVKRIDLLAAMNGVIRPSGDPIREQFVNGEIFDNHNKEVNEFLSDTLNYCIYQEQIMRFLNKFCGYSEAESDLVRRRIGKKGNTEELVPEIETRFMEYMHQHYNYTDEELQKTIDTFIDIVKASQDYSFSKNHSQPYSYTGYNAAYLRTYYPLEFIASELIINEGKMAKTAKVVEYMNTFTDITIRDLEFGYSRDEYYPDRKNNAIYKGFKSVKGMNKSESQGLHLLYDKDYDNFVDILVDIITKTKTNAGQVETLIKLDFFKKFGKGKKLLTVWDNFYNGKGILYKPTHADKTKEKRLELLYEIENNTPDEDFTIVEKAKFQLEYLGYISTIIPNLSNNIAIVTNVEINLYGTPFVTLCRMNSGEIEVIKVDKPAFIENKIEEFDIIKTIDKKTQHKKRKVDGKFIILDEKEDILTQWARVII